MTKGPVTLNYRASELAVPVPAAIEETRDLLSRLPSQSTRSFPNLADLANLAHAPWWPSSAKAPCLVVAHGELQLGKMGRAGGDHPRRRDDEPVRRRAAAQDAEVLRGPDRGVRKDWRVLCPRAPA